MGRQYLRNCFQFLLLGLCLLSSAAGADSRYFRGVLGDQLTVDPDNFSIWTWHTATNDEVRRLGLAPDDVLHAYAGECKLPDDPSLPAHGRVVEFKDGHWLGYLDMNRDGVFDAADGAPFAATDHPADVRAVARFVLPLHKGAFREMPLLMALPAKGFFLPDAPPGTARVLIGAEAQIDGQVQTPLGPVRMRFGYDLNDSTVLDQGLLDPSRTRQWMDLNRDEKIEVTPGSPEVGSTRDGAPVFRLKDLYLETSRIDVDTRTFTMKSVPADRYRRIVMGVGSQLPDFEYHTLAGKKRHLSQVKGRYILLNFWATWSAPCVANLPRLKDAYDRYHDRGFQILGMNADEDPERAIDLLDKMNITWPEAKVPSEMIDKRFQITAWPTQVLVDHHRKVLALIDDETQLETTLHKLVLAQEE